MKPERRETEYERAQREFLMARTHMARRKAFKRLEELKRRGHRPC